LNTKQGSRTNRKVKSKGETDKDRFNGGFEDYTTLRSTDKQIKGIQIASQMLEDALGVEKEKIRAIFVEVYTEWQVQESMFHYQGEDDLPQVKLAIKKILEPRLRSKLLDLFQNDVDHDKVNRAIEKLFHWYMSEYLLE
jgi:hypothetical protein